MKYKDKSVLVFDHGSYVNVALKLSEKFDKVYYYTPWETAFPTSNDTLIGSGYPNVERVNRFFDYIDKTDLFVFTDIYHSDLQEHLIKIGKRVWGAKEGDALEIYKWDFLQYLVKLGLDIPASELVIGIDNLRKVLKSVENRYIKVDAVTRGDIETFHHINYDISEPVINKLAYALGARQNEIRFIVQEPVDAVAEIGYDGYTVDGEFPDTCLFGIEVKDKGYIGEVRNYSDIPKEIQKVNNAFKETLAAYKYRGMWSTEIRVGKDGKFYFIDPTCRFPSPPTALMLEMYDNIDEIMYEGADGVLVQPKFNGKFGAEVIGKSDFVNKDAFYQLHFPEEIRQWVKTMHTCMIDGKEYSIPQQMDDNRVCEVVAYGDDIENVINTLSDRCGQIKGHQLTIDCSVLTSAISELKSL
jgi:hypothetical protein